MTANASNAIWDRVLGSASGPLAPEAAEYFLKLGFDPDDQTRITDLGEKAQAGTLTPDEREELEGYVQVGHWLALMHSKARVALGRPAGGPVPRG
jgi:hypothetical protein